MRHWRVVMSAGLPLFESWDDGGVQVLCTGSRLNPEMHEFWITRGYACPSCGAAL